MNYLTGYTIKPYEITGLGAVIFTDGTNNAIQPNQQQCEAYGYTYDRASGTCSAFRYNTNLDTSFSNTTNRINGAGNTTLSGANTIEINGTLNRAAGYNNNCLINGSSNEIANGVNNATVLGTYGTAYRDGEFVVGGGLIDDKPIQTSTFFLTRITTSGSSVAMLVAGAESVTAIPRDSSSIITYTFDITAYRTGGASVSGAIGDRAFFKLQGVLKGNATAEALTTIADDGVITGWTVASSFSSSDWSINVRGATDMDIKWTATANFYEMKI